MTFDNLLLDRDGPVALLTINRPAVLNALNVATLTDLSRAMAHLKDDEEVRAVIVTGAGPKAFVAGADINELSRLTSSAAREYAVRGQAVLQTIEHLGKPVVAAVNGFALGGGCELAMACTVRIAADSARFGQPEVNLGVIPGFAGTQRLTRLVGQGRALELLLTGDMIPAARAYDIGLVNRVVPADQLLAEARAVAVTLAGKAPIAVRYILDAVLAGADLPLARAEAHEAALFGAIAGTADAKEGTQAFLAKRPAAWTGR
jgi:enoyl-CoA hydratase